jgi:hypothetical protein
MGMAERFSRRRAADATRGGKRVSGQGDTARGSSPEVEGSKGRGAGKRRELICFLSGTDALRDQQS